MEELHKVKFVHFDLHWGNIVVKDDGSVTLLDFDLGGTVGEKSVLTRDHLNEEIDGVCRYKKIFEENTVSLDPQHDVYMVRQLLQQCSPQKCHRWNFLADKCKKEKPKTMAEMLNWLPDAPPLCECESGKEEVGEAAFQAGTGSPPQKK